jgi:hypothetical protein
MVNTQARLASRTRVEATFSLETMVDRYLETDDDVLAGTASR